MKFEDIEVEDVDFGAMLEESFKKSDSSSDLVDGVIVKIDEDENQVVVDVGRKNEAFMSLDQIRDEDGNILTNHTVGKVWCFVEADGITKVETGGLNNIAPTVLKLMDIEIPSEMDLSLI